MAFGEHLEELRRRVIRALIGVGVLLLGTMYLGTDIIGWLIRPLVHAMHEAGLPPRVVFLNATTAFTAWLKVSLLAAFILAIPWVVYQLWKFVESGLYTRERRVVYLVAPFSGAMTLLGVLFLYYVMLPVALAFFVNFSAGFPVVVADRPTPMDRVSRYVRLFTRSQAPAEEAVNGQSPQPAPNPPPQDKPPDGAADEKPIPIVTVPAVDHDPADPQPGQIWYHRDKRALRMHLDGKILTFNASAASSFEMMPNIELYLKLVLVMAIGVAAAFQLPVLMLIAGWSGIVDPRALGRARKYAVFVCFCLGAVLTPADPISMVMLALPLWLLFEFGLVLMRRTYGKRDTSEE